MENTQQTPNQNPTTPIPPTTTFPVPTAKKPWPIIALIVALIGVASYFGYQNYQLKQQLTAQQPVPTPAIVVSVPTKTTTPIPIASPTITSDPTVNWKTYTNNLSSYTFKYPSNWLLNVLTDGKQIELYFQPDKTQPVGELLIEQIAQAPGDIIQYKDQRMIGDLSAKCKSDPTVKTWCYVETTNWKLSILIIRDKNKQYNDTLDQILSTFQFTK